MTKTKKNRWMPKNAKPAMSGWYYTTNLDWSVSSRYYDDSNNTWWTSNARDGWALNDSFNEWLLVAGVH